LSRIDLKRCDFELTPNLCIFKPPSLPPGLMTAMTLKAPSLTALGRSAEHDNYKLSLAQYAEIAHIPSDSLQTVKQIHSDKVTLYAGGLPQAQPEADAVIVTGGRGFGGVFVADCLALLLFSPKGDLCAAVHAGWRGALQCIASKTVARMQELGARLDGLIVVLAAGIGVESYRVGEELLPLFEEQGHNVDAIFAAYDNGWHLDLRQTVAQDFVASGVDPNHIYDSGLCSYHDSSLLWSFRWDGKKALRNFVFCGWHGAAGFSD
jgi:YfiH family protein